MRRTGFDYSQDGRKRSRHHSDPIAKGSDEIGSGKSSADASMPIQTASPSWGRRPDNPSASLLVSGTPRRADPAMPAQAKRGKIRRLPDRSRPRNLLSEGVHTPSAIIADVPNPGESRIVGRASRTRRTR
jgi:hypothetical protein